MNRRFVQENWVFTSLRHPVTTTNSRSGSYTRCYQSFGHHMWLGHSDTQRTWFFGAWPLSRWLATGAMLLIRFSQTLKSSWASLSMETGGRSRSLGARLLQNVSGCASSVFQVPFVKLGDGLDSTVTQILDTIESSQVQVCIIFKCVLHRPTNPWTNLIRFKLKQYGVVVLVLVANQGALFTFWTKTCQGVGRWWRWRHCAFAGFRTFL